MFIGVVGCGRNTKTVSAKNNETEKVIIVHVSGMTCTGCENTIKAAVSKLKGVHEVKASFIDSVAVVRFDTTIVSKVDISNQISNSGYPVISVSNQ